MATTYIIIVAAGSGSRFGSEIPKQFLDLKGNPWWRMPSMHSAMRCLMPKYAWFCRKK